MRESGGPYDYTVGPHDRSLAVIAYPAEYPNSGVMTLSFITTASSPRKISVPIPLTLRTQLRVLIQGRTGNRCSVKSH